MSLGEQFPSVLEAARQGADWAWARLYRDLAPLVLGYLRARGASDAEDLAAEVFVQIVRNIRRFTGDERNFRSWALMVAHHRLIDSRRRGARDRAEPTDTLPEPRTARGDVEHEALEGLGSRRVRDLLTALSPDQRNVLLLRIFGDQTIDEVAAILGKRRGAVKALQRRGLARIKRLMEQEGVPL